MRIAAASQVQPAKKCALGSADTAPTDTLSVVRYDAKAEQRSLDMRRWGLIPYWAKDIKVGFLNINAKAESIDSKPAFRKSVRAASLPGAGRQLLRMEKNRDRETALCAGAR